MSTVELSDRGGAGAGAGATGSPSGDDDDSNVYYSYRERGAATVGSGDDGRRARGFARWRLQLGAVLRADVRSFKPGINFVQALVVGILTGLFMVLIRETAAPFMLPGLDGTADGPIVTVHPMAASASSSRFLVLPNRRVAYSPTGGALGAKARAVALRAALDSGVQTDNVLGFASFRELNAWNLDNEGAVGASVAFFDSDDLGLVNDGTLPPAAGQQTGTSGSESKVDYSKPAYVGKLDFGVTVGVNSSWIPWARSDDFLQQPSPCPLAQLESAPNAVCSGLLAWQEAVYRALAWEVAQNFTGATVGTSLAAAQAAAASGGYGRPTLRIRQVQSDAWIKEQGGDEVR